MGDFTICCIATHTDSRIKYTILKNNILKLSKISDFISVVASIGITPFDVLLSLKQWNDKIVNYNTINFSQYRVKNCPNMIEREDILQYYLTYGRKQKQFFEQEGEILISYLETENNNLADFGKFEFFSEKNRHFVDRIFSNIILTNDSYILTREIPDFKELFVENSEVCTILISNEVQKHLTSYLRRYSVSGFRKMINFFNSKKNNIRTFRDLIDKIELSDMELYTNPKFLFESSENANIHFDDTTFKKYLLMGYPCIKLKSLFKLRHDNFPDDFCPIQYKNLHPDLGRHSPEDATKHFLVNGIYERRAYKIEENGNHKRFFPSDFDAESYKQLHSDLRHMDDYNALSHFHHFGIREGRQYIDGNRIYFPHYSYSFLSDTLPEILSFDRNLVGEYSSDYFYRKKGNRLVKSNSSTVINGSEKCQLFRKEQYPLKHAYLFHKHLLDIEQKMEYVVMKEVPRSKRNICSIYCLKLSFLKEFFSGIFPIFRDFFDIIVTYVHEDDEITENFTHIRQKNIGMDIGPRFIVTDYLNGNYDYIMYIHSKTNKNKREQYLLPFINNLSEIEQMISQNKIGGVFHNILYYGKYGFNMNIREADLSNIWGRNECYLTEILEYLNIRKDFYLFPEGNFYLLKKDVNEFVFARSELYKCLNSEKSFDFNWVVNNYSMENGNIREVYFNFLRNKLYGNNLSTGLGWKGLADCMIEHVFERLIIAAVRSLNFNFHILDYSNEDNEKIQENQLNFYDNKELIINASTTDRLEDIVVSNFSSFKKIHILLPKNEEYLNFDIHENNICMNNELRGNSVREYLRLNVDLQELSDDKLREHYSVFGFREGRFLGNIPCVSVFFTEIEFERRIESYVSSHKKDITNFIFLEHKNGF